MKILRQKYKIIIECELELDHSVFTETEEVQNNIRNFQATINTQRLKEKIPDKISDSTEYGLSVKNVIIDISEYKFLNISYSVSKE